MIHSVSANQPTFHTVEFTAGLNVVLADRTDMSTQKDTRNGLGKSTLLEIIDFCLGAGVKKGKGLSIEPLESWAFTLDLTLAGNRVMVTRSISSPNRLVIEGATDGWIEHPDVDDKTGERVYSLERWKLILGWALFNLPRTNDAFKYKPTYRSLISYFIRRGSDAYDDPFRHFRLQKTWDIQINAGFLLGLNWEYASKWQDIKDKEEGLKALGQAIKSGAFEGVLGTVGELEAELIEVEERARREKEALKTFKVHPQYEGIQKEADRITAQIHELTNRNIVDRRKLSLYESSIASETPPSKTELESLYKESGLVFPDAVRKTLSEAKKFHKLIVLNRKDFLSTEMDRLRRKISGCHDQIKDLIDTRASSLDILTTHGALQEMTSLQARYVETEGQLERLSERIHTIKDLTTQKRDLKVAKAELAKIADQDHQQRREIWSVPVRLFNDNAQALYNSAGRLAINITEAGYKYNVEIERSSSEGIGKMKIFCFDLTMLQFSNQRSNKIDFLIHDSLLHDGVDSRQRALALERAASVSEAANYQYICTLNSDMIPQEDFSDNFDFNRYIRLTLTDEEDASGSLLGIRFEAPEK